MNDFGPTVQRIPSLAARSPPTLHQHGRGPPGIRGGDSLPDPRAPFVENRVLLFTSFTTEWRQNSTTRQKPRAF